MRALRLILAILVCLELAGAHWAVLQCGAWAGMAVHYSEDYGMREGLTRTFDGNHLCPLCRAVQNGAHQENKGAPLFSPQAFKIPSVAFTRPVFLLPTLRLESILLNRVAFCPLRAEQPPVPPPRFSLA